MGPITDLLEHPYPHLLNWGEKEALLTELVKYNHAHKMLSCSGTAIETYVSQRHVN